MTPFPHSIIRRRAARRPQLLVSAALVSVLASALNTGAPGAARAQTADDLIASDDNGGAPASATGGNGLAIGLDAEASSYDTTAVGTGATADQGSASAFGTDAAATGYGATAIGAAAAASDYESVALGVRSDASGSAGTAVGANSVANASYSLALGHGAQASDWGASALGAGAIASGNTSTALGWDALASGYEAMALGAYSQATDDEALAVGNYAVASGWDALALGNGSEATEMQAVALGTGSAYIGGEWILAGAHAYSALAAGFGAYSTGDSAVALGAFSIADEDYTVSLGSGGAGVFGAFTRRLVNVSDGIDDTDAVTLGQMNAALAGAGGGGGGGGGLIAGDNSSGADAASADGEDSVAVGWGASSAGDYSVAIGSGSVTGPYSYATAVGVESQATAGSTAAFGDYSRATEAYASAFGSEAAAAGYMATAVGARAGAEGEYSTALGADSVATGPGSIALGGSMATKLDSIAIGWNAQALGENSVALGAGSYVSEDDVISVGRAPGSPGGAATRRIVNVQTARLNATSTDAVTGAQLFATNQNVAGLGTRMDDAETDIGALQGQIAGGVIGLVQQDSGSLDVGVAALTGGTRVDFSGTAGARMLTGLGAGTLSATSADAVTGAQLYRVNRDIAQALGGGASLDAGGALLAPAYVVQGASWSDVGGALGALDTRVTANTTDIGALQSAGAGGGGGADPAELAALRQQVEMLSAALARLEAGAVSGASATGAGATAAGDGAQAAQFGDTAYGAGAQATGDPSTAVGYAALASSQHTTAIGGNAAATGALATALGQAASATGEGALALGQASSAAHANSIAIGQSAATTRADQVVIGGAQHTYTLAGLPSAASRAAQSGPASVVTSDSAGNLATMDMAPWFDRIDNTAARTTALEGRVEHELDRQGDGVAIALALGGAQMLMPDQRFAMSANVGVFDGRSAVGFGAIGRISRNVAVNAGFGTAFSSGAAAGRGGVSIGW